MNNFLYYLAAFALVLGILVVVHEFGHYAAARLCGVKVLRFSLGFGRVLWSKRHGHDQTEWAIAAFPLGGYVKMLDEREGAVAAHELPRAFNRQSLARRAVIVVAGPLANLVLALVLFWGLFWHGTQELRAILGTPVAASAAAAAGIENGERVLRVAGVEVQTWEDLRWVLISRSLDADRIDLDVINDRKEIARRRLDVSAAKVDGWQGDAFERLGLRFFRPNIPPLIATVAPNGPAASAGLAVGDEITSMDGVAVNSWPDVVSAVRNAPGVRLHVGILRQGQRSVIEVVPADYLENGHRYGRIGAGISDRSFRSDDLLVRVSYRPLPALFKAMQETWEKSAFSLVMIGRMISGDISPRNISGPLTIADYAGQSAKMGVEYYLKFLALVSVSLAVLNLLPIPILDGGHLLYYAVEALCGRPLSERAMEIGQQVGLALMLMLMAFAFYNDINRLISG